MRHQILRPRESEQVASANGDDDVDGGATFSVTHLSSFGVSRWHSMALCFYIHSVRACFTYRNCATRVPGCCFTALPLSTLLFTTFSFFFYPPQRSAFCSLPIMFMFMDTYHSTCTSPLFYSPAFLLFLYTFSCCYLSSIDLKSTAPCYHLLLSVCLSVIAQPQTLLNPPHDIAQHHLSSSL